MKVVTGTGVKTYVVGQDATRYGTFDSRPDPDTAGTALPYSVSTAGVILKGGAVLLVNVFAGAQALLPPS